MLHNDVKSYVDNNDISSLKYFFCDCLDGDPTFSEYEDDYEYCKSKGALFEEHKELDPMVLNNVNEEYWIRLKKNFMENPSIKRLEHMREAAKILYSSRIRKIEEEKAKKNNIKPVAQKPVPVSKQTPEPLENTVSKHEEQPKVYAGSSTSVPNTSNNAEVHRVSEPVRTGSSYSASVNAGTENDGIRRVSEPIRTGRTYSTSVNAGTEHDGIRRVSEPVMNRPVQKNTQPKKSNGVGRIAVALIAVAIVVIVVICLLNK